MKIIAFGASTSRASINKALATYAAKLAENAQVKVLDLNDYVVPMFSEDKEKEVGQAEGAKKFLRDITEADAIIISFAEHNGTYTAAYKNLFDWTTRIELNVFQHKPVIYLATSPGPGGAQSVLAQALGSAEYFGANVKGSLSVPNFYDSFDLLENKMRDQKLAEKVSALVATLG